MTRNHDSDDRDDGSGGERGGFGIGIGIGVRTIADILRELDDRGRASGSGRRDGVDIDYTARTGLGPRPEGRDREHTPRERKKRSWPTEGSDDYLVEARREDDDLVVTADLPGVEEDNLVLGVDEDADELVLGVDGRQVERVPLPWGNVEVASASYNNNVLVARLREAEEADE